MAPRRVAKFCTTDLNHVLRFFVIKKNLRSQNLALSIRFWRFEICTRNHDACPNAT